MNKSFPLLLVLFSIFICGLYYGTVNANPNDTPPSFEEGFTEVGYKSVKAAVKEFENHFKCDVKLPEMLPSISFTHQFGRFFEDKNFNVNDSLEIRFVNKDIRENIFKIDIRPSKNKLNFENKLNLNGKEYTLQDGTKGIYFEDRLFNFIVFEKNNLQYMFGIYNKVANTETPDTLVRIANSID
ncbi:carbon monoxide dehydrogenase [Lysinibacillus contaminans]|uniref:Carbon monoxide dehydrogenase n=1 Tax=Lysinibacillus contaminans TaxID=1293441 RepID=A0ABR5JWP6_9BACI|nr:carbon monoxide dehydrogenase [Lysinibacillus contaminans]